MGYPRSEQETVLTYFCVKDVWIAYSCVPRHMRKLMKIAPNTVKVTFDNDERPLSVTATLSEKQVRLVTKRTSKDYSKEERQAIRERLSKSRSKKIDSSSWKNDVPNEIEARFVERGEEMTLNEVIAEMEYVIDMITAGGSSYNDDPDDAEVLMEACKKFVVIYKK